MTDLKNEDQGGDNSFSESSEDNNSFGEVIERDETATEDEQSTEVSAEADTGETTTAGNKGEADKTAEADKPDEGKTDETPESKVEEPVLTEKGTKLDPDPLSAAHQQLANEKRTRSQMEQVLANPELLAKFMETQYGIKINVPSKEQEAAPAQKEYTAEDFESLDDVARVVNGLQTDFAEKTKAYETQIQELKSSVSGLLSGGKAQQLANTMSDEVDSLRKEPELDAKNPDFIEGLEADISSMYHKLDFDEKTGLYKGNYSIKDIGSRIIATARKARQKGSLKAQTVVKDKSEGKVVTSPKVKDEPGSESLNPGDSIAAGVSKLFS